MILSWMIFIPLVAAALLYLLPLFSPHRDSEGYAVRGFSLLVTLAVLAISILVLLRFVAQDTGFQFQESVSWIPAFGITYTLGIDGISLVLLLLTTVLMPIIIIASGSVHSNVRGYLASMLVLQSAMLGTLCALDIFLFYIFWELMLAPMYFIIGIWGGKNRIYATLKFVLYTMVGSVLMLVAILYLVWSVYEQTGTLTFLLADLLSSSKLTTTQELWIFAAFILAFGIKVPIFPFHTWLPDAHVEAPTGGSVVLAGVLLKMGIYGMIRFAYPLCPRAAEVFAPYLAVLAVIGIVYGALVAWAQTDIKKLVAYSSVSHLGYCVLGLVAFNTLSATGSVYQLLNHGISTGALFLLVGVLYDRRHTRLISEYGGLARQVPVFAALFLVFTLSSIAVPLTNGFVGEFLILAGSFRTFPWLTVISLLGVVLGAVYMLSLYRRTMFGELDIAKNGMLKDISRREILTLLPLLVLVFWMGIYPKPLLKIIEPSVENFIALVDARKAVMIAAEDALQQPVVYARNIENLR